MRRNAAAERGTSGTNGAAVGPVPGVQVRPVPERRCAIYTRVSTDEQAALDYNSLQAQEEICKNYIAIRAADPAMERKWVHAETYSDAGYSGGTLERPSLKRLLADVEAGRIDIIIAYKIDRVSRSISQFYEVWNLLERHGVDFASATQEFNTATSQGKLMLNLLLSFAQYERELISERTRDKVAAAKRRGRWCGGMAVLGYDIDRERKALVVNEHEAEIVRDIFATYLREMSLLKTIRVISARGYLTKQWVSSTGRRRGGATFDKVTLSNLLKNPIYIGKVPHKDKLYDGVHAPIVDVATFERVQQLLGDNWRCRSSHAEDVQGFLLQGLVRCAACNRAMSPHFAWSRGRRYLYYRCGRATREGAGACPIRSVSAPALEDLLLQRIRFLADNEQVLARMVERYRETAERRLPELTAQRDRLGGELRRLRAEAGHLVDLVATGAASASRTVADRLKDVEAKIDVEEQRLAEVNREIGREASRTATPEQMRNALRGFLDVWSHLETSERKQLVRALVAEVVYDGRSREIVWRLRPLTNGAANGTATPGFAEWKDWLRMRAARPTSSPRLPQVANPLSNSISSNHGHFDDLLLRAPSNGVRPPPRRRPDVPPV